MPEAGTFETAKSYREKKAVPLIKKLVQVIFSLHRKYWEMKHDRDKYQSFYRSEKDAIRNLKERLEQAEAENERLYAIKRDFERVWNYFGAKKMNHASEARRGSSTCAAFLPSDIPAPPALPSAPDPQAGLPPDPEAVVTPSGSKSRYFLRPGTLPADTGCREKYSAEERYELARHCIRLRHRHPLTQMKMPII